MLTDIFLWVLYSPLVVTTVKPEWIKLLFMYLQRAKERMNILSRVKCISCLYYCIALAVLSRPSVHRQAVCYLRGQDIKWLCKPLYFEDFLHLKISVSRVGSRYQRQEWVWNGMTWWNFSHAEPTVNRILCVLCVHVPSALHVGWGANVC